MELHKSSSMLVIDDLQRQPSLVLTVRNYLSQLELPGEAEKPVGTNPGAQGEGRKEA